MRDPTFACSVHSCWVSKCSLDPTYIFRLLSAPAVLAPALSGYAGLSAGAHRKPWGSSYSFIPFVVPVTTGIHVGERGNAERKLRRVVGARLRGHDVWGWVERLTQEKLSPLRRTRAFSGHPADATPYRVAQGFEVELGFRGLSGSTDRDGVMKRRFWIGLAGWGKSARAPDESPGLPSH